MQGAREEVRGREVLPLSDRSSALCLPSPFSATAPDLHPSALSTAGDKLPSASTAPCSLRGTSPQQTGRGHTPTGEKGAGSATCQVRG
jgi:hypothetical protein